MIRADRLDRIRARRAARPARSRVPLARQPDAQRRVYSARLRAIVARLGALVREELAPVAAEIADAAPAAPRADAPPADGGGYGIPPPPPPAAAAAPAPGFNARLRRALARALERWTAEFPAHELERLGTLVGTNTSAHQRRQWMAQVKAIVGVDPTLTEPWLVDAIAVFARTNADLIRNLAEDTIRSIQEHVTEAVQGGARNETISKTLQARLGVSENRANLIARDQTGKFFADLAQTRQQEAGVTHYYWRSVQDAQVREPHRANNGKRFAWASPPPEGHPGEDVQCRCSAEPDLAAAFAAFGAVAPVREIAPVPESLRGAPESTRGREAAEAAREAARAAPTSAGPSRPYVSPPLTDPAVVVAEGRRAAAGSAVTRPRGARNR